jgi:hypothetical protein
MDLIWVRAINSQRRVGCKKKESEENMKKYEITKNNEISYLTKKEIKEQLNFCGSLAKVEQIELLNNKLYLTKKNGDVTCYSNVHGSWGFGTRLM